MLRRILFRLHWLVGISAGSVLAIVGATGATLSFEDALLRWMNPGVIRIVPQAAQPLTPHELLARVAASHPQRRVASLTLSSDPTSAVRVAFVDREARYADPYTARVSDGLRGAGFFRLAEQVHRRLAAGDIGKQIVGACTLALVGLCLSGFCLRWPRKRPGTLRHLHTTAGTWVLAAYLLAGLTGLHWSYGWYRDGLYALAGAVRPAPAQALPGALDLARGWATFRREVPAYDQVTLRLPQRAAQALDLRYLDSGAPHERAFSRLTLDPASGAVLRHERYAELPVGSRLVRSIFALHSGSFFGLPGVIAIMLASLCMPFFAISGWVMYLRRTRRLRDSRGLVRPATAMQAHQPAAPRAARSVGALVAIAMHGLAALALLTYEPARAALFAAAPIMVDFIAPPKVEPQPEPPVEIAPPKPKPRPKPKPIAKPRPKPPEPKPVVQAPVEAPTPVLAPAPPPPPEPEPAPAPVIAAAPPAPVPVVPVTAPVFNAAYLKNPPPGYPALSRRMGEEGRVVLRVRVNASGTADEVQIRDSSGHARLDEAARDTVRRWRFAPAKRGEHPIAAWVLIPISFKLEG